MTGVCFYYEPNDVDVWSGRNSDLDAWNYAFKLNSGITDAYVINTTQQSLSSFDGDMNVQFVTQRPNLPGVVTQVVCPWEITSPISNSLWGFDHQTDWYCFGPASGWGLDYFGNQFVTIPQNGNGAVHSVHACTVVMAHRYKVIG